MKGEREDGSKIAKAFGGSGADQDDTDAMPAGDGKPGDGLSRYEEYRGVHVNGQHQRLDPDTKELFVRIDANNTDMPAFRLNPDQIHDLLFYLKTLE